jgi:hypothetical protein
MGCGGMLLMQEENKKMQKYHCPRQIQVFIF